MLDGLGGGDSLVVPALWPLEVANALTVLRRRRKLTREEVRSAIEIIRELPVIIDHEAAALAFTRLVGLASELEVTV
ncbi:MAG TPA: type II toxin-antitoxin system VapC family toxin, partial [Thermoanaerobaculia bacterium]|nr:type II toxin-antitoxin system VapC family toxin [Thermoanaerobaculia bacterium]